MSKIYPASGKALDAAEYMLANQDSRKNVHQHAEEVRMMEDFIVCPKYIRTVRTMLDEKCPPELVMELRKKAISVPDAKMDFEEFKSGRRADLRNIEVMYLLTTDGDETVGKIGVSKDVRRHIRDLELAAGPMTLRGCWRFASRPDANAVKDKILKMFLAADGGRERIAGWDYMAICELAVDGGGRWVPLSEKNLPLVTSA